MGIRQRKGLVVEKHSVVSAGLVPQGRDEAGHDNPQFWVRRHDEYGS
jgi:predicted dithiol-disulfide oxidoreductase (DUF899 family)